MSPRVSITPCRKNDIIQSMITKLLVIAGAGSYPELVVKGAKRAGVERVDVLAVKGSTARATKKVADAVREFDMGCLSEGIRWTGEQGYDGAIFAGQINPLSLFRFSFDSGIKEFLASLPVKNAHSIFKGVIDLFAKVGVKILPSSLFMDDNLPGSGKLTERGFTAQENQDIEHAIKVARDVGSHDVGQTVMVKAGMVLAVEAFEGTNAAIKRGGKLGGRGGVIFKAAREGHDMRFDIPVIGLKTLKVAKRAGVSAIGFQAGRLVMLDREAVIAYANKHSIAIEGVESGLPAAPTRI